MSIWHAAETLAVSKSSIYMRLKGVVPMDSKAGASTVLTREEEAVLVDSLLWARRPQLALSRSGLLDTVRALHFDGRLAPWNLETGPGRTWVHANLHLSGAFSEVILLFQTPVLDSSCFGRE